QSVALAADGKKMVTTNPWGETPCTLLWDLTADPPRVTHRLWAAVAVAFSPDSQTVALTGGNKLALVDVATGKEKLAHPIIAGLLRCVAFSPDGQILACGCDDQTVRLWNPVTGQERSYAHGSRVFSVAFSPDGTMLASGGEGELVKLWDVTWKPDAASLPHPDTVTALAFSPDGRTLATGCANTVRLWDLSEKREVTRLTLSTGNLERGVAFAHDGKSLAVGGGRTIKLFDTAQWQEKATLDGHRSDVHNLAFSPDDRTLAAASFSATERCWPPEVRV